MISQVETTTAEAGAEIREEEDGEDAAEVWMSRAWRILHFTRIVQPALKTVHVFEISEARII